MRSVLAYLGVEYDEQPKKIGELKFVLQKYERIDPANYSKAIDVVINHSPEHEAKQVIIEDGTNVSKVIAELVKEYENSSVKEFAGRVSDILENATSNFDVKLDSLDDRSAEAIISMTKRAEVIWKEEAKKHRKIIVEQSGSGVKKELKGVLPEEFEDMLALADERQNIMMVGPAGAGKTYLAEQLAIALDMKFGSQSCSAGISESVFIGWLLPTGENAKFSHVGTTFLDIYENGGVFLFDEMDASDPNTLTFLNQSLANEGFHLPQRFDNPYVKKHKDFIAVSACNTFGQGADAMYHARNALDGATLDRFKMGMTVIDYSDIVEESLIDPNVLKWGRTIRSIIDKHNLVKIMSTRTLMGASKMYLNKSWSIDKIADKYFQDWSKEERAIIKTGGGNLGEPKKENNGTFNDW